MYQSTAEPFLSRLRGYDEGMELRESTLGPAKPRPSATPWFVRTQGQTLGPFRDVDVLEGLAAHDFFPSDRIYSVKDRIWVPLEEHPHFAEAIRERQARRAADLTVLPSPRKLRVKAPPPPVPILLQDPSEPREFESGKRETGQVPTSGLELAEPVVAAAIPLPPVVPFTPMITEEAAFAEEIATAPSGAAVPLPQPKSPPIVEAKTEPVLPVELPREIPPVLADAVVTVEVEKPSAIVETPLAAEIPAEIELTPTVLEALAAFEAIPARAEVQDPPPPPRAPEPPIAAPDPDPVPSTLLDYGLPEMRPVFLSNPQTWESPKEKRGKTIQIELKLPEKPLKMLLAFALVAAVALAAGYYGSSLQNKTRGQNGFRLSDPSSPTTQPQDLGDPIPPLKAPTRPQRE